MNRSMYNTLMQKVEQVIRQNGAIEEKLDEQRLLLDQSSIQSYLHPIPRPRQGKEMSRSVNVAGYLRAEIETRNENISAGSRKYLQFPSTLDDKRANRDAIRTLEGLLSYHLPDDFGYNTWEQTYARRPRQCEKLIREASSHQDLKVFAQAAAQWAIRMLLSSKMKTRKRSLRSLEDIAGNQEENVAVANEVVHPTIPQVSEDEPAASIVPNFMIGGHEVGLVERSESQQQGLQNLENSGNGEIHDVSNIENSDRTFQVEETDSQHVTNADTQTGNFIEAEVSTVLVANGSEGSRAGGTGRNVEASASPRTKKGSRGRGSSTKSVTLRGGITRGVTTKGRATNGGANRGGASRGGASRGGTTRGGTTRGGTARRNNNRSDNNTAGKTRGGKSGTGAIRTGATGVGTTVEGTIRGATNRANTTTRDRTRDNANIGGALVEGPPSTVGHSTIPQSSQEQVPTGEKPSENGNTSNNRKRRRTPRAGLSANKAPRRRNSNI